MRFLPAYFLLASALVAPPAVAQKLQPGEVRLTMGSWYGTAEIDAFTKTEKLILSTMRNGSGMVLRCMDGELSIGWMAFAMGGSFNEGDEGQLSLRVGEDVIGPIRLTALNKAFMAGDIDGTTLDRIAKAKREIGFQIAFEAKSATGGLGALKTPEVVARLKKSCSGQETISAEKKQQLAPKGDGTVEEHVE